MYIKWGTGRAIKERKGIEQKYTANGQQTGRTLRDKGDIEGKKVGARPVKILTLSKFTQIKQTNKHTQDK